MKPNEKTVNVHYVACDHSHLITVGELRKRQQATASMLSKLPIFGLPKETQDRCPHLGTARFYGPCPNCKR